jgi:hypothetical protein
MALVYNDEYRTALEILKLGINNGAIKLIGPNNAVNAVHHAKADAAYITAFLEGLAATLPSD